MPEAMPDAMPEALPDVCHSESESESSLGTALKGDAVGCGDTLTSIPGVITPSLPTPKGEVT